MQKDIEIKGTKQIIAREKRTEKKVTIEEQINTELHSQSINREERTNKIIKYINVVDL